MNELPFEREVRIELLLASPVHRYDGRPADGPLPYDGEESREAIELRAGLGIVGDRFFAKKAHARASVTVMAAESLDAITRELGLSAVPDPVAARRNILIRGVDIDAMRHATFSLDSGDGPVVFVANRPANPCAWMNVMLAPGAHKALRHRGGMRCEPLTDGVLRLGTALLRSSVAFP